MAVAAPVARPVVATGPPPRRDPRPAYAGAALGGAVFLLAALLGRLTMLEGQSFATVWPAAGVGLVWFVLRGARPLGPDTVVLATVAFAGNLLTGAGPALAAVLAMVNVVQVLVHLTLLRRCAPEVAAPRPRLDSLTALGSLVCSAVLAAAAAVVLGGLGVAAVTRVPATPVDLMVWFGRLLTGSLVVGSVALLSAQRWQNRGQRPPAGPGRHQLEAWGLALLTVATILVVFRTELPLSFTLVALTVWSAKRFRTLTSAWHSVATATAAVLFTLDGEGPFSLIDDPRLAALTVQGFVTMLCLLGLFVSLARDEREELIVQLEQARDESRQQAQLLASIVDSMDEGVTAVDARGGLLLQNPAALRLLEIDESRTPDQLAPRARATDGTPLADDRRPSVRALRGEHVREQLVLERPDGGVRHLDVSAIPLAALSAHDTARAVMVFRDVTSEVEQEAALRAFAATVAHDVHNPLAAIVGWNAVMADLLAEADGPDRLDLAQLQELTARVGGSADRLGELVEGLLEDATSRDRTLDLTVVDLGEELTRVARSRGAEDLVRWEPLPPVRADRLLLGQVLDNLVGNALKYVAPGVTPDVRVEASLHDRGWVRVWVVDNGIGIPAGRHEAVFAQFAREHEGYRGTGLGLAIVRKIVERHGGSISAHPRAGGSGTVFQLTLPAA